MRCLWATDVGRWLCLRNRLRERLSMCVCCAGLVYACAAVLTARVCCCAGRLGLQGDVGKGPGLMCMVETVGMVVLLCMCCGNSGAG